LITDSDFQLRLGSRLTADGTSEYSSAVLMELDTIHQRADR